MARPSNPGPPQGLKAEINRAIGQYGPVSQRKYPEFYQWLVNNPELRGLGIPAVDRFVPVSELEERSERRKAERQQTAQETAAREAANAALSLLPRVESSVAESSSDAAALQRSLAFQYSSVEGIEGDVEMSDSADDASTTDDDASTTTDTDDEKEVTMSGTDDDKSTVTDSGDEDTATEDSDNETVVPDNENELTINEDDDLGAADETLTLKSTPSPLPRPTTGALCLPVVGNAVTQPQVLPSYIFAAELGKVYDRNWITKYNISMRAIDRAMDRGVSKYKLAELVRHGVFKEGDRLRVKYKDRALFRGEDYGEDDFYDGEILPGFREKKYKKNHPDVRIAPEHDMVRGVVYDCQGPSVLVQEIAARLGNPASITNGWKGVWLIDSEDENLGSLHSIRQIFHAFKEQMEAYIQAHGQAVTRSRRVKHARPSMQLPAHQR